MAITLPGIARLRLRNQLITAPLSGNPATVVDHLLVVQSQDFTGARWALGMRLHRASAAAIDRAYDDGRILRTHVLRPTWHFVTPKDIRWLLQLTAPRVLLRSAVPYRNAGVTASMFRKAEAVMQRALSGPTFLTRLELHERLQGAGLETRGEFRLGHILEHAELVGLICSGPFRGKKLTYALLDDRAPALRTFDRQSALAELALRFFTTRGPATVHDLAKWSTLTMPECRLGLEAVKHRLHSETLDKQQYWFVEASAPRLKSPTAHLLSVYDEYLSSYRGHTAIAPAEISRRLRLMGVALTGVVLIDGMVVATWKRSLTKDAARITIDPFGRLTSAHNKAIALAANAFARFHSLRLEVGTRHTVP